MNRTSSADSRLNQEGLISDRSKPQPCAKDIIAEDLDYICNNLTEEFGAMAGKNLLITGGAGFLGYYFVQSVLHWNQKQDSAQQIRLTVYDNYSRGVPTWLMDLKGDPTLTLLKHDMTQPLPSTMSDFQYIIHAASIASPTFYRRDPIGTMDANVNGLRNLLEFFKNQQAQGKEVGGFLFFSSSEIYGDPSPENIPTSEDYRGYVSCTGPRACYDEAKRYGETLCVNFAQQYGLPIKSARPFNNFGPGLKITDRRLLPDFARDVLSGKDITMLSDGSPKRTFCYSADSIVGYYKVLVKGHPGEAYNIGIESPEISVAELAEQVVSISKQLFGYTGKVIRKVSEDKDYLVDNPNRRCPVIEKARTHLGYNPTILIEEGLRRSLIWYQDNQEAEDA
ncbi:MAG TPA: NAD-dependent epimerase/dehydratase family protein [Leptolyngbya sp.]|nr:NAD-dependent epimerase/dehydratase family protein [Leptolyngbya sp.]